MTFTDTIKKIILGEQAVKNNKLTSGEKAAAADGAKELVDASILLAETTKADADLLAKTTKADADLLAKTTKANSDLLARTTKASADLLAKETKDYAEDIRKSNEAYIGWTKWMTTVLIMLGFIQIIIAIIPFFRSGK